MTHSNRTVIDASSAVFDGSLRELFSYRNLIRLFVVRNYSTRYKQTILGPAWLFITPLCTVFTYSVLFGGIAGLSTDGVPGPLFYLSGVIVWNFFSGCVTEVSNTFTGNAGLFGKIYFPRLAVPVSVILTRLLDFMIQLILFLALMALYCFFGVKSGINRYVLLFPLALIQLSLLGLGTGLLITSVTTKYRDLTVLVGFGLQIWLYVSPIIYPLSLIPEKYISFYLLNPVTPSAILIKHAFLGNGLFPLYYWGISWIETLVICICGMLLFHRTEKTFLDVI